MISKEEIEELKSLLFKDQLTQHGKRKLIEYIEQIENKVRIKDEALKEFGQVVKDMCSDKQKLIDKLKKRILDVEKCYNNLVEPYLDKTINMIYVSLMTKKEREEFINKRNCLLVQKQCYEEILLIVKGEKS